MSIVSIDSDNTRSEHDLLGNRDVPSQAYYGVHTLRAIENFPITGLPISHYPDLVRALAEIKIAAALTNQELGMLDAKNVKPLWRLARRFCRAICMNNSSSI